MQKFPKRVLFVEKSAATLLFTFLKIEMGSYWLKLESPELKLGSYCSRPRPVTHRASAYELFKTRDGSIVFIVKLLIMKGANQSKNLAKKPSNFIIKF